MIFVSFQLHRCRATSRCNTVVGPGCNGVYFEARPVSKHACSHSITPEVRILLSQRHGNAVLARNPLAAAVQVPPQPSDVSQSSGPRLGLRLLDDSVGVRQNKKNCDAAA
jgi:hypothetical protein